MRYLLLCLLLYQPAAWAAPPPARPPLADTLRLAAINYGPWTPYFNYCLDAPGQPAAGARAAALWRRGQFRAAQHGRVLQVGYTHQRLWLRATVHNTLPQRTRFVWSLYEFVDSAALFVQRAGGAEPRFEAGASGRLVARRRPFPARATCLPFWLAAGERATVYLAVDNTTGAVYLPTDLTTTEDFLAYETGFLVEKNWLWLLGLYLGSGLFNLVLFVFLRDRIHLWYGAYVVLTTWFLLMEDGVDALLLPQGLYHLGWSLGQYSILLLALACGLRVLALFVRLRQGFPRLYRLSWWLSGVAAAWVLAYGVLGGGARRAGGAELAWLNTGREALLGALLLAGAAPLLAVGLRGGLHQRRLAGLYGLTYVFFLFGAGQFLLNRSGVVNLHFVEPNSLAWGLALELLTLSILLTGRFRHALRQAAELRLNRLREREAAGQRLIAAQDEEREALARELHDALAPGLTALHLAWQGRQVQQALTHAPPVLAEAHQHTEALLRQLRHEVRTLGQALLPTPAGPALPLPEAVQLLADTLTLADGGPEIACRCDPAAAHLPPPLQAAAYRLLAELLHNALRHAQARLIVLEVACQPGCLLLRVEDDGRGFDPAQAHGTPGRGGLGLRGVQARVRYLRGQLRLRSRPGYGTSVRLELPVG